MKKETALKFLSDNRDGLMKLADLVKDAERKSNSYEDFTAKKCAKLIIEKWISDIFNIAYSVDEMPTDEESIFRRLDRERQEGRTDAY